MASLGTLVGTGTSSGGATTMTITCTSSQLAAEIVHMFWMTDHETTLNQSQILSVVDSRSGTWTLATSTLALIGHTDESDGVNLHRYLIGSFIRTSGPAFQSADTITVTFANNPPPSYASAIVQGFLGITNNAVKQNMGHYGSSVDISPSSTFIEYANGDSYISGDPDQLLWRVDYSGLQLNPAPAQDCAYVALFGCIDGSGFTPEQLGSTVAELTNGPTYLAVVFDPLIHATGIALEPGGSFDGASSTVGNYQFVEAVGGFRAWQRF